MLNDRALVVDARPASTGPGGLADRALRAPQARLVAVDADVLHHHRRPGRGGCRWRRSPDLWPTRPPRARRARARSRPSADVGHADALDVLGHLAARRAGRTPAGRRASWCPAGSRRGRDTQARLAGRVQPGHDRARRVAGDPRVEVGRDAAHRVVRRRLDRHRLGAAARRPGRSRAKSVMSGSFSSITLRPRWRTSR